MERISKEPTNRLRVYFPIHIGSVDIGPGEIKIGNGYAELGWTVPSPDCFGSMPPPLPLAHTPTGRPGTGSSPRWSQRGKGGTLADPDVFKSQIIYSTKG